MFITTIYTPSIYNHIAQETIFPHSSRKKEKKTSHLPHKTMMLSILHLTLLSLIIYQTTFFVSAVDPTIGFTCDPLDSSHYVIQKPYDVSLNELTALQMVCTNFGYTPQISLSRVAVLHNHERKFV
jgi:hypothetical protein